MSETTGDSTAKEETWDDINARLLKEDQDFLSAIADLPESEIYGLVGANGAGGAGNSDEGEWTMDVNLVAWKSADGVIHAAKGRVEKRPMSRAELRQWMEDIRPYCVLHLRGRAAPHPRFGMKMLLSEIVSVRHRDTDLEAVAMDLQQPVTFEDPDFGTFILDRRVKCFESCPLWQGKKIRLSLDVDESLETKECLEVARTLWRDQDGWARKVNDRAVAELLDLKNGNWLDEGEKKVTADQFKNRMKLQSVGVCPDGTFEFWHDDGDLFLGHTIHVWGNLTEGVKDAGIEG